MSNELNKQTSVNDSTTELNQLLDTLTAKQRLFCETYVATRDVSASYSDAYKSTNQASAAAAGRRLMTQDKINAYILHLISEYAPVPRLSMPEIISELEKIAMTDDVSSATKLKALTLLGQSYGNLTDKVEVTHREFNIDIIDSE